MASCEDCMYVEVCPFKHYRCENDRMEKRCSFFRDHSLFVELPCKVGDTIYVVEKGKIIEDSVVTLYVAYFGGDEETFQFDGIKTDGYFSDFGKTVFLTQEEAEQALQTLKGSESNAR